MSLLRNRRITAVVVLGLFALVSLYFTNLVQFHLGHSVKIRLFFDAPDDSKRTKEMKRPEEYQCEKITIRQSSVDIKTERLWFHLFGPNATETPKLDAWLINNKDERNVTLDEPKLRVFVLPHSHVDPGWLKTVGEYTGETNSMLDNMLQYMPQHPNMTFTWMEMTFFERWWRGLAQKEKDLTKQLISERRFQITSGSWVMTDEASTYFWASIDNIVEGHQFLKRELGVLPSVMWSNDPFGYGPTVSYLFRLANVTRLVLQRLHSAVKSHLGQRRSLDFYYRQFFDPSGRFDTQVHSLPFVHYDIPHSCGPDENVCCMVDFVRMDKWACGGGYAEPITVQNIADKAKQLMEQYRHLGRVYRNNVVLTMLGDDFRYGEMKEWSLQHDNYMLLMDYMNQQEDWNIEVRFGTFNDFFNAFAERSPGDQNRLDLPSISGDFFPYNDVSDNYWTGYFTTRPFYKRQDRVVQAMIRAADILSSLVHFRGLDSKSHWPEKLKESHRNLALFQHHDAITGTSKWKVVEDYGKRLQQALLNASEVASEAVSLLVGGKGDELRWSQSMPHHDQAPIDRLFTLKLNEEGILWVFNTLPYQRSELVHIHVSITDCLTVTDSDGKALKAQLNPIFTLTGVDNRPVFQLLFDAQLPPLAAVYFKLSHTATPTADCAQFPRIFVGGSRVDELTFPKHVSVQPLNVSGNGGMVKLENEIIATYHNASNGFLQAIKRQTSYTLPDSKIWKGQVDFWHYTDTDSGAYLFYPHRPVERWRYNTTAVVVLHGTVTDEIHSFGNCIHHKEYIRKASTFPEPDVQVHVENTLDIRSQDNIEMVMRISNNDVKNPSGMFLTDSMGLQLMPRQFLPNRPIYTNYYPMASQLVLQNDWKRLTLVSGQPHGVTSPDPGTLEVMLDRRLTMDDSKGLGMDSLVRDNVPVTSYFRLILESGDFAQSRSLSLRAQRSLQDLLYPSVTLMQSGAAEKLTQFTPLEQSFPCDTLLLNIRSLNWQSINGRGDRKHLLLLHRVVDECRAISDKLCRGSSHKDLTNQLTLLLKNPLAEGCTLSGVETESGSSNGPKQLDHYLNSLAPLERMEIRSVCIS